MSDNETLADIVAELRADANAVMDDLHNDDCWTNVEAGEIYASLANRIEAAAERERNAHINDIHNALYAATRLPGSAAAMREALREMLTRLVAGIHDGSLDCYKALEIVESALAEPPRNCDIGETDDQQYRFERLCNASPYCAGCPVYKRWGKRPKSCGIIWAQMPYEKEGAK